LTAILFSEELKDFYRVSKTDFTRQRKQSFSGTILLILNRITKTISIEIDNFIQVLQQRQTTIDQSYFSKSAFVQCRQKIKYDVFIHLSKQLIHEFYSDNELGVKLWRGFRLLAVDGTHLTLPNSNELRNYYGEAKNQTNVVSIQARASVLYDVLNGFVIDSVLAPLSKAERSIAVNHLDSAKEGDLILYDRGYPSFEMVFEHKQINVDFVFRIKLGFNNQVKDFVASKKKTDIIKLYPPKHAVLSAKPYGPKNYYLVRLVKVILPGGDIEVLMTSLVDRVKYVNELFKDLYFKRWKVETFYDELKNKLQVMEFSGYSIKAITQDFYSSIFVSNIQTVFTEEINDELREETENKKYTYKINVNLSYGILKNRILEIFLSGRPMVEITKEIKELLKRNTVPIRPNRKYQRDKFKYRKRNKPKVTKNQKNAF